MKKGLKRMVVMLLAVILVLAFSGQVFAAGGTWRLNNKGWWYQHTDGTYPYSQWEKIDGKWYHFNASGYMQTGWIKDGGKWYYLDGSGAMYTGWLKYSGEWYYLNGNGDMKTGWLKNSGKWYYLNKSGVMQTGWKKIDGLWYYFNSNGSMKTGWFKYSGKWYYLNGNGDMNTGWLTNKGHRYYMNKSGVMQTGWQEINGDLYYFQDSGIMVTGEQIIDGQREYFAEDGVWMYSGSPVAAWKEAYAAIVKTYEMQFGRATYYDWGDEDYPHSEGVFFLDLIDFDHNGRDELVIAYNTKGGANRYGAIVEVFTFLGNTTAGKVYGGTVGDGVYNPGMNVDCEFIVIYHYPSFSAICAGNLDYSLIGYNSYGQFGTKATRSFSMGGIFPDESTIDFGFGSVISKDIYLFYGCDSYTISQMRAKVNATRAELGLQ